MFCKISHINIAAQKNNIHEPEESMKNRCRAGQVENMKTYVLTEVRIKILN